MTEKKAQERHTDAVSDTCIGDPIEATAKGTHVIDNQDGQRRDTGGADVRAQQIAARLDALTTALDVIEKLVTFSLEIGLVPTPEGPRWLL